MDGSVIIVSVVRDYDMYHRCVSGNQWLKDCEIVTFDNRIENRGVSECYNEFIGKLGSERDAWIVFCHEDFQLLEDIAPKLATCDRSRLWGVTGSRTRRILPWVGGYWKSENVGRIQQSKKDGSGLHEEGVDIKDATAVDTLDCQCIIIHTSLLKRHPLRFDEKLPFDLYVEDFCINAAENYGVGSSVMPIACRHWSGGVIGERYFEGERYLEKKYPHSCYAAPAHYAVGGGGPILRRIQIRLDRNGTTSKIANFLFKLLPKARQI